MHNLFMALSRLRIMFTCTLFLFVFPSQAQIDYTNCPDCSSNDINFLTQVATKYQGIHGTNPSAPSTYNLIGKRKFSGTGYSISNSFFGENWYPIRTEKQLLTGRVHHFGVSNYGDESDWNIHMLPNPGFEDFLSDAIPYQRDNWYASGDWGTDEQGRFLIEAEITPDEHKYGNPWFNNKTKQSTLINKTITVYGPFVREEAHGNHPEIHPSEQIWWKENEETYIVLLLTDDSNRFKRRADTAYQSGAALTYVPGDFTARRVTTYAYQPWALEKKQESELQIAFELNPANQGYYVSLQALDDQQFFTEANYSDAANGSKYSISYLGNVVLTVEETSGIDPFIGVSFRNVCFNRAKGVLQGYIVLNTAISNGDGKEGFVALRIDKRNVGVNARTELLTGDIANTWKSFAPYDNSISFAQIISSDKEGKGIIDGILDFNGNGKSDLFAKSGNRWMVLYDGRGNWQEIQNSNVPEKDLRFGDVDGNGKTDILRVRSDHKVLISYDGTGSWQVLTDAGEQTTYLQVADFNGDNKTDLVYFKYKAIGISYPVKWGGDMFVKFSGTGPWRKINNDYNLDNKEDYLANFRFGNFNGDAITDVFRYNKGRFGVYWNGAGDFKELMRPPAAVTTSNLLFVTGLSMPNVTDVIYRDPLSKKWTVFYGGLPGSLPLEIKYNSPSEVHFADLDTDPAVEPFALGFARANPADVPMPLVDRAVIQSTVQLKYVKGSLTRKMIDGSERLVINQDVHYYPGNAPTRRNRPAELAINKVKEVNGSRDVIYSPVANASAERAAMVKLGTVKEVPLGKQRNKLQLTFANNSEQQENDIPAFGITAIPEEIKETRQMNGNWRNWLVYLNSKAVPTKKVLLQQPPGTVSTTSTVSFDLHPLYSGLEKNKANLVETDGFTEELNEALYAKTPDAGMRLFGTGQPFQISWNFSVLNHNSGTSTPASATITDGLFSKSQVQFQFPPSGDLLEFIATATITDKFGNSSSDPIRVSFWNQQIVIDDPQKIKQWIQPYLNAPSREGYVWVIDHWERKRANAKFLLPAQFATRASYYGDDGVLTAEEMLSLLTIW